MELSTEELELIHGLIEEHQEYLANTANYALGMSFNTIALLEIKISHTISDRHNAR